MSLLQQQISYHLVIIYLSGYFYQIFIHFIIMSTPLEGGHIIFAFSGVRRQLSGVQRPPSVVTHGFRSFQGKVFIHLYQIWYGCLLG